jgi:hypothetical protein
MHAVASDSAYAWADSPQLAVWLHIQELCVRQCFFGLGKKGGLAFSTDPDTFFEVSAPDKLTSNQTNLSLF